ncbi:MAG: HAD family phosphatase [Oscillospiraceae bacterium]|nr:HAD family phosphatase [Oscillospiraceae bacterium]
MNIVFDIGNVLIDYRPEIYVKALFPDLSLAEKINKIIFKSPEWLDMDRGMLTHKEATEIFCKREPDFADTIRHTMQKYCMMFSPSQDFCKTFIAMQDTIDLLPRIKELGHDLYYLSNMHFETRDYLLENHSFFNRFDGGVFSCDVNVIKPSPEIYRHFLKKYKLNPKECIFFDDMEENVSAAEKEGIKSVLFTTADCVLEYL